jgi:hypothetical protein
MPELNPSAQRCLPRLLLLILIFKWLTALHLYKSFVIKGLNFNAEIKPLQAMLPAQTFTADFNFYMAHCATSL